MTNGYCTEADLRDHLGDSGTRLPLTQIERAIMAASRAVDNHTGRHFWKDTLPTVRTYRPEFGDMAWVDDVASTGSTVVEVNTDGSGVWSPWVRGTDFELAPRNIESQMPDGYAWWRIDVIGDVRLPIIRNRDTLRVTASHGWSAVPVAVNEATILKAASIFQRKDAVFGVAGFGEFGPVRITRKDPDVIDLLRGYERGWA